MRRLYRFLPGPPVVRIALIAAGMIAAVVLLGILFEWAGGLLDNGGTLGLISP
jgi:tetrahydromethanopterin S-methyltransferase subunit F